MTRGVGRNKGRGRRIPLNTQAKEFKTMILLLKTVNLPASWRADCAVNVNVLFCLAINSGPARDQMKYSRWKEIFCESLCIPDESYMPLLGDNTVSIPKQFLLLLKTLLFYGCWGRGRGRGSEGGGVRTTRLPPPSRGSPTVPYNLVLSSDETSFKELRTITPLNYFSSFPVRLFSHPAFYIKLKRPCPVRWGRTKLNKRCFFLC